ERLLQPEEEPGAPLGRCAAVRLEAPRVVQAVEVERQLAVGIDGHREEPARPVDLPAYPAPLAVPGAPLGRSAFEGELHLDRQRDLAALAELDNRVVSGGLLPPCFALARQTRDSGIE